MNQTKFILLYLSIFLFFGNTKTAQAQFENSQLKFKQTNLTKKELRNQIPKYYGIGLGLNNSNFRDFATSPLVYKGTGLQVSFSRLKMDANKESEIGVAYDFGTNSTSFDANASSSKIKRVELNYGRLYKLGLLSSESFNTKFGFLLTGNGNLRINTELQNNAVGIDLFANLSGSVKLTKDLSRKVAKEKKFLFWNYTQKEITRDLAFRMNVGMINSSHRNGYVYAGQSAILNQLRIFDNYQFKIFSGLRMSSALDYTRYLKNKNGMRLSYEWDAYATAGELDKFEMAHHTVKFTLLFNTNNQ